MLSPSTTGRSAETLGPRSDATPCTATFIQFLSGVARHAFRTALPADEDAGGRGRGWKLELGIRCAAYAAGNPLLSEIGTYTICQVLTELDTMADA